MLKQSVMISNWIHQINTHKIDDSFTGDDLFLKSNEYQQFEQQAANSNQKIQTMALSPSNSSINDQIRRKSCLNATISLSTSGKPKKKESSISIKRELSTIQEFCNNVKNKQNSHRNLEDIVENLNPEHEKLLALSNMRMTMSPNFLKREIPYF